MNQLAKFSIRGPATPRGPIATAARQADTRTYEGAAGWRRDPKGELFVLAACSLVGEDTFYESGADRDARLRDLVHAVVADDPGWVARLVPYLRRELHLRSAPVVIAAEYVAAGGPAGRSVVRAALRRADEPAELLGYCLSTYGRRLPAALKRGVADGARDLTPSVPPPSTTAPAGRCGWVTCSSSPTRVPATPRSRRCSAGCSTAATAATTRGSMRRACCCSPPASGCWRPHPRSAVRCSPTRPSGSRPPA